MFGFPAESEIKKIIAKDALLGRVGILPPATATQKTLFNADIIQVSITNVVSTKNLPVSQGTKIPGFYVARVTLRNKNFETKSIEMLLRRIGQKNILLTLSIGDVARFALKYDEHIVVSSEWVQVDSFRFVFSGLDLDAVWNGIVKQVAGEPWNDSLTVAENLDTHERIAKLQKEIASLEKKARAENQPARKFEFFNQMKAKLTELAEVSNNPLSFHSERSA